MSFLNQLKSQANALQTQKGQELRTLEENTAQSEAACRRALSYLQDAARHLNVIGPAAPAFSLDGRTPWPAMKLTEFHVDARRKTLRDREVFGHIAMGWKIVPQVGHPVGGLVRVNFPPDLKRVEERLAMGPVKHDRKELRHPENSSLLAIEFNYITETRGSVSITPDHEGAKLSFRLLNAKGFGIQKVSWAADEVKTSVLDELAKLIVSESSRFEP